MRTDPRSAWPVRRLTELVDLPIGQVDPRSEPYRSRVLLAPDHVESGTGRIIKRETAHDQNAISGKYVVEPGDVVFSKIRPSLRKVVLADFSGICSADMYPLRPRAQVTGGFLLAVLLGEDFSQYVANLAGRTGIPKVNRRDLEGFLVAVPTLAEQRRIVEVIDAVEAQERAVEASIAKYTKILGGVAQEVEAGLSNGPMGCVGEFFQVGSGITLGPERRPTNRTRCYLRVANVQRGMIDLSDVAMLEELPGDEGKYAVAAGDILMVEGHANPFEIGRCALVSEAEAGYLHQNHLFRLRPGRSVDGRFADFWLNSWAAKSYWLRTAATSSGLYTIPRQAVGRMPFPRVEISAQKSLLRQIEALSRLIDSSERELSKLAQFKSGLADSLLAVRR